MIKNKKEAQCALICFKPFGIVQTALHIARCSLPYSSRLEAKQREHCASSSSSLHSGLINRSQCLSASEVGLKNCLVRNSSTGSCHEPVLKVLVGPQPHQYRFVAPTGTKGWNWSRFVPPTGTNGLAQRRGGEFSPTSLAEREPHLFIRCGAPELSSSSLKQAYGPNLSVHACGPTGPSAGLNPGPWMGFQSYSGRGGPVGGIIFSSVFSLLLYLFCFVSTYNEKTYLFYF